MFGRSQRRRRRLSTCIRMREYFGILSHELCVVRRSRCYFIIIMCDSIGCCRCCQWWVWARRAWTSSSVVFVEWWRVDRFPVLFNGWWRRRWWCEMDGWMVECLDELQKIFLLQRRTCASSRNPLLSTISTATTHHSCHRVYFGWLVCLPPPAYLLCVCKCMCELQRLP